MSKKDQPQLPARRGNPPDGKYIRWGADGNPYPAYCDPINKAQTNALINAASLTPYVAEKRIDKDGNERETLERDKRFEGQACLQVGLEKIAQDAGRGKLEAVAFLLDRTIGKPKQTQEIVGVIGTPEEWLALAGQRMREEDQAGENVSAEVMAIDVSEIFVTKENVDKVRAKPKTKTKRKIDFI